MEEEESSTVLEKEHKHYGEESDGKGNDDEWSSEDLLEVFVREPKHKPKSKPKPKVELLLESKVELLIEQRFKCEEKNCGTVFPVRFSTQEQLDSHYRQWHKPKANLSPLRPSDPNVLSLLDVLSLPSCGYTSVKKNMRYEILKGIKTITGVTIKWEEKSRIDAALGELVAKIRKRRHGKDKFLKYEKLWLESQQLLGV